MDQCPPWTMGRWVPKNDGGVKSRHSRRSIRAAGGGRGPSRAGSPGRPGTPAGNRLFEGRVRRYSTCRAILSASRAFPGRGGQSAPRRPPHYPRRRRRRGRSPETSPGASPRAVSMPLPKAPARTTRSSRAIPRRFIINLAPASRAGLGELHAPDILLADRDLLVPGRSLAPGDDEFRLPVVRAQARRVRSPAETGRYCR